MFEVTVEACFSSGHYLRNYYGKCENPHGHNYRVLVTLAGAELDETGLLLDFKLLKTLLKPIVNYLDHQMINDLAPFTELNPSAENLARYGDLKEVPAILVQCSDGLWYAATRQEIESLLSGSAPDPGSPTPDSKGAAARTPSEPPDPALTLEQRLGSERTPILFPDMPLASALPHFRRWPLLPVTNRAVRGALEGAISLEDVLKRYQQR